MIGNGPWHYRIDGATHGPVDLRTLRAALSARGEITVREEGSQAWLRPDEVPGLLDPFAGPADPNWPNSPTKVFLYLAAAIAAAKLGALGPVVAIAVAYAALTSYGWPRADAVPLACVFGLAAGFGLAYAEATLWPQDVGPAWYDVLLDVVVPIGLAALYVSRRSRAALLALLALQAAALAFAMVVATTSWVPLQIAAHAVALLGLTRIARQRDAWRPATSQPPSIHSQ